MTTPTLTPPPLILSLSPPLVSSPGHCCCCFEDGNLQQQHFNQLKFHSLQWHWWWWWHWSSGCALFPPSSSAVRNALLALLLLLYGAHFLFAQQLLSSGGGPLGGHCRLPLLLPLLSSTILFQAIRQSDLPFDLICPKIFYRRIKPGHFPPLFPFLSFPFWHRFCLLSWSLRFIFSLHFLLLLLQMTTWHDI